MELRVKIFFLILMSFSVMPLYTMDDASASFSSGRSMAIIDPNGALANAVEETYKNKFSDESCTNILACLQNGADPNFRHPQKNMPLLKIAIDIAIGLKKENLFNCLIQHPNINVNNNLLGDVKLSMLPLHYTLMLSGNIDKNVHRNIIKKLLERGAAPNAVCNFTQSGLRTPLGLAVQERNVDAIRLLVHHGAKVDRCYEEYGQTPLECIFGKIWKRIENNENQTEETIAVLCQEGAPLIFNNIFSKHVSTIFHSIVNNLDFISQKAIENVMIHATSATRAEKEKIRKKFFVTLLFFQRLGLPKDIQYNILAQLPVDELCTSKGLCKKLYTDKYLSDVYVRIVGKRIEDFQKILQIKDAKERTPLEKLNSRVEQRYKNELTSLFNGSKLQNDFDEFTQIFPKENWEEVVLETKNQNNNLAYKICKRYIDGKITSNVLKLQPEAQ